MTLNAEAYFQFDFGHERNCESLLKRPEVQTAPFQSLSQPGVENFVLHPPEWADYNPTH
ncbi:MAG: hypothetical protein ACE361_23245 [Aureliella sp.]